MTSKLLIEPDPTVLLYITGGAMVTVALGLAFGLLCGSLALFGEGKLRSIHLPYFVVGVLVAGYFLYSALPAFSVQTPSIALEGDSLSVGDERVALNAETEILHASETPSFPSKGKKNYSAMPNGVAFPPRFAGGPKIVVRSAGKTVTFQPLLYGPGRFLDEGQPQASALIARLLTFGDRGNARAWLAEAFPLITGEPPTPPATKWFYILYFLFAIPVIGFLAGVLIMGIRKKFNL